MVLALRINVWDYRLGSARLEGPILSDRCLTHFCEHIFTTCGRCEACGPSHRSLQADLSGAESGNLQRGSGVLSECLYAHHCQSHCLCYLHLYLSSYNTEITSWVDLSSMVLSLCVLSGKNQLGQRGRSLCKVHNATG